MKKIGEKCWVWLQVFALNFMYCQGVGSRMLLDGMLHSKKPTAAQESSLKKFVDFSRMWLEDETEDMIKAERWEKAAEELGDMYTGANVGKSYALTLEAILPTTPGAGEAARIPLADVVSDSVKPFVESPKDLRIPDEELVAPRTHAAVQVASQEEWDKIVEHLVNAGMLEREVKEETLRYQGTEVRNGAFGVHKAWVLREDGSWLRTLRLIINMIPANTFQRRMPVRASEKMSYGPAWGNLYMHEDEVLLCAAEDQKHCFHIYRPGYVWRGFFTLSRGASGKSFHDGNKLPGYPRVKSAPMGWNNVVDFIQDGFESMAKGAGLNPKQMIRMGEPSPLQPLTTPRSYYSFYVDNFDELVMVWNTDRGSYEGKVTDAQLKLRDKMEALTVGRGPKKAAEGSISWTSLGAEVAGEAGLVGSAKKFRRALLSSNLGLLGEGSVRTDSLNLQSVVSKNMRSVQYCRPLSCLFDQLYLNMNQPSVRMLNEKGRDEVILLSSALPMHWLDLKAKANGNVFATDASEEGGGACMSTALTTWGLSRLQSMSHEDEGIEGTRTERAIVVECFAGIGGAKQALDLLGFEPMGVIAIDNSPESAKVYRQHCRHAVWIQDIKSIQEADVYEWRKRFPKAEVVILTGGWPCINHSKLNVKRQGATGASSLLLDDMIQIGKWLEQAANLPGVKPWSVIKLFENVVLGDQDFAVQSKKIGVTPIFLEAGQLGRCRRPRLYWLQGLDLIGGQDLKDKGRKQMKGQNYMVREVKIDTERPPLTWFLNEGASKMSDPEDEFATFTRPIPRKAPPDEPAGLAQASEKAKKRWQGDSYRLPPYQYESRNLVLDKNGPRRPTVEEQLRMMGFCSNHLTVKNKLSQDVRGQLLGNTFHVVAVARLLAGLVVREADCANLDVTLALWETWQAKEAKAQQEDKPWKVRFASVACGVPGVVSLLQRVLPSPATPLRAWIDPQGWMTDEEMLAYLLARNGTHRGGEIRVDLGTPFSIGEVCRQSVDPGHWAWKVLLSYQWREPGQHINILELVAVLDLLRRQARDPKQHGLRHLLMIDNQVALSALSKGRSSSRSVQAPLRRINAVCLASHFRLCLAWVKSKWNPADGPSRWAKKKPTHPA